MQARGYKQDSNGDLFVPEDGKNGQNGGATAAATKNNGAAAMNPTVAAASQDYGRRSRRLSQLPCRSPCERGRM